MLPCKGTRMFMWAGKSAMACGACLPLRGGVGVFQANGAHRRGAGQGKKVFELSKEEQQQTLGSLKVLLYGLLWFSH